MRRRWRGARGGALRRPRAQGAPPRSVCYPGSPSPRRASGRLETRRPDRHELTLSAGTSELEGLTCHPGGASARRGESALGSRFPPRGVRTCAFGADENFPLAPTEVTSLLAEDGTLLCFRSKPSLWRATTSQHVMRQSQGPENSSIPEGGPCQTR